MIRFHNGHHFDIGCAAGALGFTGDGYLWEWPSRRLGYIRPDEITVITKTLTFFPRAGYYRWWKPWETFALVPGGTVNCLGLPNPGYYWWVSRAYPRVQRAGYKVVVSVYADNPSEAAGMATELNRCKDIVGVELNVGCPNVLNVKKLAHHNEIIGAVLSRTDHPLVLKLGVSDPYLDVCREWDGKVAAFDLINSVPWRKVYREGRSPLSRHGYAGSVSGPPIRDIARSTLKEVKDAGIKTPVISGGGIYDADEARLRIKMGADAVTLGTIFVRSALRLRPWLPRDIVREFRKEAV